MRVVQEKSLSVEDVSKRQDPLSPHPPVFRPAWIHDPRTLALLQMSQETVPVRKRLGLNREINYKVKKINN